TSSRSAAGGAGGVESERLDQRVEVRGVGRRADRAHGPLVLDPEYRLARADERLVQGALLFLLSLLVDGEVEAAHQPLLLIEIVLETDGQSAGVRRRGQELV